MEKLYEGTGDVPALKAIWSNLKDFPKSLSLSATVAGILIVLIATFGTGPIVVQAAIAGKLTDAQTASWFFTVLVGSGLYGLYLSLRMRMPLIGA